MNEITSLITELIDFFKVKDYLLSFFLALTRWIVFTTMIPFLGAHLLPAIVRIALSTLFAIISLFVTNNPISIEFSWPFMGLLFLKEAFVGFLLGFFASLLFYAYELFGQLIDFCRAASMSKMLVPEVKHQSSQLGSLFFQFSLVLFIALGLHRPVIEALLLSFTAIPLYELPYDIFAQANFSLMAKILAKLFKSAVMFGSPIIFVCFLIDLGFGLLNRVAPQVNAYFLSLPAKIISGLIILFFILPFLLDDFKAHHNSMLSFLNSLLS